MTSLLSEAGSMSEAIEAHAEPDESAPVPTSVRAPELDSVVGRTHEPLAGVVVAVTALGLFLGFATSALLRHRTRRSS
jgi:hypothetical protein